MEFWQRPTASNIGHWRHGPRLVYERYGCANRGSGSACGEAWAVQKEGGMMKKISWWEIWWVAVGIVAANFVEPVIESAFLGWHFSGVIPAAVRGALGGALASLAYHLLRPKNSK
jgi:hypothetical protein